MTRAQALSLSTYDTDKIAHGYLAVYDELFADLIDRPITLLEIGILRGGSLRLWRDYFPKGSIVGIDIQVPSDFIPGDRIQVFEGSQGDAPFLASVARRTAPHGFDVIIDDASHVAALTRTAFWSLFDRHLKPGGLYVIEDWGTGYWTDWPDGEREPQHLHVSGMVGFIKELVDEQGAADLTRRTLHGVPDAESKFESLTLCPSIAIVRKRRR